MNARVRFTIPSPSHSSPGVRRIEMSPLFGRYRYREFPPLMLDERLNLWLNMLNAKIDYLISVSSQVVRVETTLNKSGAYTLGVQFLDMDDAIREEILNVDFKKIIRRNNI